MKVKGIRYKAYSNMQQKVFTYFILSIDERHNFFLGIVIDARVIVMPLLPRVMLGTKVCSRTASMITCLAVVGKPWKRENLINICLFFAGRGLSPLRSFPGCTTAEHRTTRSASENPTDCDLWGHKKESN